MTSVATSRLGAAKNPAVVLAQTRLRGFIGRLRCIVDAHVYPSRVWAEIARDVERERAQ